MQKRFWSLAALLFCGLSLTAADLLSGAVARGEGSTTARISQANGKNALTISGQTKVVTYKGNQYLTANIILPKPVDLKNQAVTFKITSSGNNTRPVGMFLRTYTATNKKSLDAMWSFVGWDFRFSDKPQTLTLVPEKPGRMRWENGVATLAKGTVATNFRIFIATREPSVKLHLEITDMQLVPISKIRKANDAVPAGLLKNFGGVKRITTAFNQATRQKDASRADAIGIEYNRSTGKYAGFNLFMKKPFSLEGKALKVMIRGDQPPHGLYFRFYNKGKRDAVWSLNSWNKPAEKAWRPIILQKGGSSTMSWDAEYVKDTSPADQIDRIEIIVGEHTASNKTFDIEIGGFQLADQAPQITKLAKVAPLMRTQDFSGKVVILHPDTPAGKDAAAIVAKAVPGAEVRPGTAADQGLPAKSTIVLGNVFNNPAVLRLYARRQFPADQAFPGRGKYFVTAIPEIFRTGQSVAGAGASDDMSLLEAAQVLAVELKKKNRVLDANYFATNREIRKPAANHMEQGMKVAQQRLDNGVHTSLGGYLATIGNRYIQTRRSEDAKLYAEVCRLYDKTSVPDARKFGGPWGFDSDFLSFDAINGFDAVEHDPALSDQDRLDMTRCIARWLVEAIVHEARGGLRGNTAVWNHLTFCSMGTMAGAYYFNKYYPDTEEPKIWEAIAKHNFGRQIDCTKAIDDCNGYQWHVWNHLMTYTNASGDMTFITNGTAEKVMRSMLLTMDNYGLQVPYGDTGSWKCWLSEVPVLQAYLAATESPLAQYILKRKREWTLPNGLASAGSANAYLGELPADIPEPANYFGVQKLELDGKYYAGQGATGGLKLNQCFDKLSMRENFDRQGFYILIDGVNNGGHKHADGNSILRHTQYDRVWLADNDYFKSQQKFHNTLLLNINGEAGQMDPYIEYLDHGDNDQFGWYAGRVNKLAGKADWTRYVVWLKNEKAYAVLDQVAVNQNASLLLKQRWHGMGEVDKKNDGAQLSQKGPAMRYHGFADSRYNYANDYELGANWTGYPHAGKVVRVIDQIAEKQVKAGEKAVIGGVWHGSADGNVAPWKVSEIANGMKIDTGKTAYTITVKADGKLNIARTASAGPVREQSVADGAAAKLPGRAFRKIWAKQTSRTGKFYFTEYAKDFPFTLSGTKVTGFNKLVADAPNRISSLTDNSMNGADDSVMLEPDQQADWTITFRKPQTFTGATLYCWWANNSSKGTKHQIKDYTIYVDGKKVASQNLSKAVYPNFGKPVRFDAEFKPVTGSKIRFVINPGKGSSLYISELMAAGNPPPNARIKNIFEEFTASANLGSDLLTGSASGILRCMAPNGTIRWEKDLRHGRIHCITVADITGDGTPEILLGTEFNKVLILNKDGSALNEIKFEHYRVRPEVTIVRVADITGDGKPEIIAGCDNWRTYAFTAAGKLMWHHEVVHPTRAVTVADLTGDGIPEILCGTKYYSMSVLNNKGIRVWRSNFGPGCRTIETPVAADGSIRVVAGSDDGNIYFHTHAGKRLGFFNTGDEVRVQATAGKGKGQKLWSGSFNGYVYQFSAEGKLLTYTAIPGEVTALQALPNGSVIAGTGNGVVVEIDPKGRIVRYARLGGWVSSITLQNGKFAVTTMNGEVALFGL